VKKNTETYKDQLTTYYNAVEETIIVLFGSFEKAAEWFDAPEHAIELNNLWRFCESKFLASWHASRAANEWYNLHVKKQPATPSVSKPEPVKITYYSRVPEIDEEVKRARAARKRFWENAYLI
jgi:hypothetical protein